MTTPTEAARASGQTEHAMDDRDFDAPAGPLGQPSPLWYTAEENLPGGKYDQDYSAWEAAWENAHECNQ